MQACERMCCSAATIPKAALAGLDPPFGACADELYMWGRLEEDALLHRSRSVQQRGLQVGVQQVGVGTRAEACEGFLRLRLGAGLGYIWVI